MPFYDEILTAIFVFLSAWFIIITSNNDPQPSIVILDQSPSD